MSGVFGASYAVVGGGLAGIAAALELADAGARVTLFERRNHLGGATWSFERNGLHFDNGQHVYLRCCTAYRRFLERIGSAADSPLQARLEIPVLSPRPGADPVVSVIRRSGLPAPTHLVASLMGYRHLSLADRLRLGGAVRALLAASADDPALDQETFGQFLRRAGQRTSAIERLWDLICLPTTNVRAEEVSAAVAVKVFRTGLLEEADAADIGWSKVPLAELHGSAALRALAQAGVEVRLGAKIDALELHPETDRPRIAALRLDGAEVPSDGVVLAVPHLQAAELLPSAALSDVGALAGLGSSPIVDVHVVYAEQVTDLPIAAALDSPVQYVFDRSGAAGIPPGEGQCLAVSVSGADAEHGERPEVLIERYTTALAALFPRAATTPVLDAVVSREHHATFKAVPGTARLRPGPATAVGGLVLAGSWTDTGWPATMEGAVRSGTRAAWQLRTGERRSVGRWSEEVVA